MKICENCKSTHIKFRKTKVLGKVNKNKFLYLFDCLDCGWGVSYHENSSSKKPTNG